MDHLRFVFSLLLIVSVTTTTFGSAIKAQNKPNGEELEEQRSGPDLSTYPEMAPNRKALLKRLNLGMKNDAGAKLQGRKDLENQKSKRKVEAVRTLAFSIENNSGYKWTSPSVYFFSGEAGNKILTDPLDTGKALMLNEQSTSMKRGIAGVLTYYIPPINSTLAAMFSVPFEIGLPFFSNVWNVQLFSGNKEADCEKYLKGFFFCFKEGSFKGRELSDSGLRFDGIMGADSVDASLVIEVRPVKQK